MRVDVFSALNASPSRYEKRSRLRGATTLLVDCRVLRTVWSVRYGMTPCQENTLRTCGMAKRPMYSDRAPPPSWIPRLDQSLNPWQLESARASGERDRLNRDEYAGDFGPEADHRPRRLRPGEELRVRLVHLPVEVGPREQHANLHHAVKHAPDSFEDGLDAAQSLTGLLLHRVTDDLDGAASRPHRYLA